MTCWAYEGKTDCVNLLLWLLVWGQGCWQREEVCLCLRMCVWRLYKITATSLQHLMEFHHINMNQWLGSVLVIVSIVQSLLQQFCLIHFHCVSQG